MPAAAGHSAARCGVMVTAVVIAGLPGAVLPAAPPFPDRPVRLVVPFPPAGANDIVARQIAAQLAERWGRPVVVDNRAGAGGLLGTEIGARAAADGYTLTVASTSTFAAPVGLYARLPFDPVRDFAPITQAVSAPNVLVVHPGVAAHSVKELVALATAKPGALHYSSFGSGSSAHLVGEMFRHLAGVNIVHVPYKGGGPALLAVLGGEVQLTFANLSAAMPHIKTGKVRVLGVTGTQRSPALPDAPTVSDAGVPGFVATAWVGFAAPAKTPAALVNRLHGDFVAVLAVPALRTWFASQGLEIVANRPSEFAQHVRDDIARWTRVIKAAGIKLD